MGKKINRINKIIGYLMANESATFTELKKEVNINDTELNKLLHELTDVKIIEKKGRKYYLYEYIKDPEIKEKLDNAILDVLKLLSEISGISVNDYIDLKANISILINYLLR